MWTNCENSAARFKKHPVVRVLQTRQQDPRNRRSRSHTTQILGTAFQPFGRDKMIALFCRILQSRVSNAPQKVLAKKTAQDSDPTQNRNKGESNLT